MISIHSRRHIATLNYMHTQYHQSSTPSIINTAVCMHINTHMLCISLFPCKFISARPPANQNGQGGQRTQNPNQGGGSFTAVSLSYHQPHTAVCYCCWDLGYPWVTL